ASYLEQGQRLENLSWRLWHLQNLIVDTDNAKSKREFKKLSKTMGDKLDKEKGRSIEELEAPDFKRNASSDLLRQRAVEKERSREASQNAKPGTIKRMQFTFSVDQPPPATPNVALKKPDLKPSADFKEATGKRGRPTTRSSANYDDPNDCSADSNFNDRDVPRRRRVPSNAETPTLRFPTLFSNDFGPSALLYPTPTLTTSMNYGEGVGCNGSSDGFSIIRPTIELPLDELLSNVDPTENNHWPYSHHGDFQSDQESKPVVESDIVMFPIQTDYRDVSEASDTDLEMMSTDSSSHVPPISQAVKEALPLTVVPSKVGPSSGTGANTPTGRPTLTVKTSPVTRSSGPGATATNVNPAILRNTNNNSAPGGVKAECSNCGATHTPLWRRGLNDELNCNACGLYCKLHKRPRPKSMRSNHGEGRTQAAPRQETVDVMVAQCYNCHTTATPLWRKDDEGKTVCNACGLYYKLHGSARPISMKSDVIRKRSRHDARRVGPGTSETPSASPGASRRASPTVEPSPTLAPDSTTQPTYDYSEESEMHSTQSELMNALGQDHNGNSGSYSMQSSYSSIFNPFPGPYHPDYLNQNYHPPADALPFSTVDALETENSGSGARSNKRRRMSTDSASEPPSSAVSFSSYNDSFSGHSSATSQSRRSSMDFPFFSPYSILRGSGNTFWHPPMLPQDRSPQVIHPPMLPTDDTPMDFLHPPMLPQEEETLFATYLHPPMLLPSDESPSTHTSSLHPHPPMFPNDPLYNHGHSSSQAEFYDSAMQTF
ncbi:hypothetical protein SERLA73DRAFT_65990, partial [Serpula lacrymans var. lacrymans S7.3]